MIFTFFTTENDMALNPKRTVEELKELRALTGDENGAQRVAWTDTWLAAREWFARKLAELPVEHHYDAAGNNWATLAGESKQALMLGGHLDSVPNGGWLDGALNVLAALEVLRRFAEEFNGRPPVTVRLVDWADEEGARFGRSLLGSSAFAGTHSIAADRVRTDRDGIKLEDALRRCGMEMDRFPEAGKERQNAAGYLELHIEQGPVLEKLGSSSRRGSGHQGSRASQHNFSRARSSLWLHADECATRRACSRCEAGAGNSQYCAQASRRGMHHGEPQDISRHRDRRGGPLRSNAGPARPGVDILAQLFQEAQEASRRFAEEEKCTVEWSRIWNIEPVPFHPALIDLCEEAVREVSGTSHRMPSGPLHDAAEVSRAGIPAVMMFVQSLGGISHNKIEDTREEHLEMSVVALDRLASKTLDWILRA